MDAVTKQLTPRERILKTVDCLFYEQGYLATGINQIIAEAQVAKASFYQHFPSKESLVLEYLKVRNTEFLNHIKQVEKQFSEPKAKILALFDDLADCAKQTEYRGCFFVNLTAEFSQPESKPRQLIARFKIELKTHIEQLALKALPDDNDSSLLIATTIYLLYEAALLETRIHHDLWPIEVSKAVTNRLLS
ncbi:MAG: TetR/AcrR family transcriptional regulator [Cyanobacteria bacterium P01_G01_bin.49]